MATNFGQPFTFGQLATARAHLAAAHRNHGLDKVSAMIQKGSMDGGTPIASILRVIRTGRTDLEALYTETGNENPNPLAHNSTPTPIYLEAMQYALIAR